jgi:hypothetical protein
MIDRERARVLIPTLGVIWLLLSGLGAAPEILPDRVTFLGGKVVRYETSKVVQDPAACMGGEVVSFTERPVILRILKRVVFVRRERLCEGGATQLTVYDFSGTLLGSSERVALAADGPFFLESKKRIFLGQSSSHVEITESFLLDENGRLLRSVSQPRDVASFGHSRDEELVWIVSNIWTSAGKKIGELRIIDTNGNLVVRREFDRAQTVRIQYKGKTYRIPVEVPTLP